MNQPVCGAYVKPSAPERRSTKTKHMDDKRFGILMKTEKEKVGEGAYFPSMGRWFLVVCAMCKDVCGVCWDWRGRG